MVKTNETILKYIIPNITESVLSLFNYNWSGPFSFSAWLTYTSDSDFKYIYEMEFKRHFLVFFTTDTDRILSYHAHNLSHALNSLFEIENNHSRITTFIRIFIKTQLKNLNSDDLFMEN
jgi:hypothetical protein